MTLCLQGHRLRTVIAMRLQEVEEVAITRIDSCRLRMDMVDNEAEVEMRGRSWLLRLLGPAMRASSKEADMLVDMIVEEEDRVEDKDCRVDLQQVEGDLDCQIVHEVIGREWNLDCVVKAKESSYVAYHRMRQKAVLMPQIVGMVFYIYHRLWI
jgi:hypothetical protein